jgi:hypothetical protein
LIVTKKIVKFRLKLKFLLCFATTASWMSREKKDPKTFNFTIELTHHKHFKKLYLSTYFTTINPNLNPNTKLNTQIENDSKMDVFYVIEQTRLEST